MLKRIRIRVFGNSFVLAMVAVAVGALAMVFLFVIFAGAPEAPPATSEAPGEAPGISAPEDERPLAAGEVFPVAIQGLPAPFIAPDDGAVLGFVFIDVTIEVIGEAARERAEAGRAELMAHFTNAMAEAGVGMAGQPGVVDYDRLAALFLTIAEADVGAGEVARIVIQPAAEG